MTVSNRTGLFGRTWVVIAIGGGVSGLISTITTIEGASGFLEHLVWGAFACIYVVGVWIGLRIAEGERESVRALTKYFWIQVPVLQTSTVSYFFSAIGSLRVIYRGDSVLDFGWMIGGGWKFSFLSMQPQFGVGINVFPLVLIVICRAVSRFE